MSGPCSLLGATQALLERAWGIPGGLVRAERFVIGDRGLRALYLEPGRPEVRAGDGTGARLLLREAHGAARVCVYFPDAMIRTLERYPPWAGVADENVDSFATLVEEVDHLLVVAERAAAGRPVSRFELELHANVSKWLVVGRFLAGRRPRLTDRERVWLRWNLFAKHRFADDEPEVRERYRDAARHAVRFLDALARTGRRRRGHLLREFHTCGVADKLRLIERADAAA